ncbi:MAG: YggS family pyridoxal phosphate-dependent enzyme [Gemmatimonadaceae bacterium]|nr:YggS family pyridoxal phosphate-dependent enzyme [Gemmatimonadaceae bacterium]MDQ3242341.1 YggS family pyridoxal phosphate-dependent enzyme [Gemmatimonadota bacterium]
MLFPELGARVAQARGCITAAARRGGRVSDVTIVAVTKTHGSAAPREAWEAGIADVGENKVQEALGKMNEVSPPVRWHLIGHLQRNKVSSLASFALFHALDSSRLADAIDRFGSERGSPIPVLLQVNASGEGTKGGFTPLAVPAEAARLAGMSGLSVRGAMTMARLDAGEQELRDTFAAARTARQALADEGHPATELSMGMSNDYEIAVEEGATLVRLGSILFGARGT